MYAAGSYKIIGCVTIDVTKTYKFTWLGDIDGAKPYDLLGSGGFYFAHTGRSAETRWICRKMSRCQGVSRLTSNVQRASIDDSTELQGPRELLRIRPEIFDFEPDLKLKLGQTTPKISGTVPTDRHTTIPNDSGPISACFDNDPKLEIAQPKQRVSKNLTEWL